MRGGGQGDHGEWLRQARIRVHHRQQTQQRSRTTGHLTFQEGVAGPSQAGEAWPPETWGSPPGVGRSTHSPAQTRTLFPAKGCSKYKAEKTAYARWTGWQSSEPWEGGWQGQIGMAGTTAKTQPGELYLGGKNERRERPRVILGHQWESETEKPSGQP